jgi:uncharacterized protein (TIGR02757 family)
MTQEALRDVLDAVRAREDLRARRDADPVGFVHRYRAKDDREIVALASACLALGNVKAIRMKVGALLERIGPSPAKAADDPTALFAALDGWKHRLFKGEDVARLLIGARKVQRQNGSLGAAFAKALRKADRGDLAAEEAFREALASFCDRIREAGGLPAPGEKSPDGRRGPVHLLSNARAGSAAKRSFLFLRWMTREADGIDLGLWNGIVPASRLVMPLDVHIHKLARNLGLTKRSDLSWKTAIEVTRALARFDPEDPTRYDFSLCHLGMVQRCPSKKDEARCEGCGVKPVCVHWRTRTARTA